MDEAILRYAPPDEVVRLAKEAGMTTGQIVRIVSGCLPYRGALQVARDYAPLLEISISEFMELRKNVGLRYTLAMTTSIARCDEIMAFLGSHPRQSTVQS